MTEAEKLDELIRMVRREVFAGIALHAMLQSRSGWSQEQYAAGAYQQADAMLKASGKFEFPK